jgi:hypothetical protein
MQKNILGIIFFEDFSVLKVCQEKNLFIVIWWHNGVEKEAGSESGKHKNNEA